MTPDSPATHKTSLEPEAGSPSLSTDPAWAEHTPSSSNPIKASGLESEVHEQLAAARSAQQAWAEWTPRARCCVLRALRETLAGNPLGIASECGRGDVVETMTAEILPLLDACRFLEVEAPRILAERSPGRRGRPKWLWGTRLALRNEPVGVALIIGPSNYPLMLPGIQALQALAAGNGVLLKPAPGCSQPLRSLASIVEAAGLPRGLVQILPEQPHAATTAIERGVDKVFVTGSRATGRALAQQLAGSVTPSVMELSGCDAVFVQDDADPALVSACLLFGARLNQGRTCLAPRRVFARDQMVDRICSILRQDMRQHPQKGLGGTTQPSSHARGTLRRAAHVIDEAVRAGATLVAGDVQVVDGHRELRSLAIVDRVRSEMKLAQEDLFAPVVSFIRIASMEQALLENAKCPFALGASVFGHPQRSRDLARRVQAGCVVVNDMVVPAADPRVPLAGRKMSGHGTTRGEAGLLEMTQTKAIVTARRWFKPHLQPRAPQDAALVAQLIALEHGASPLRRFRSSLRLISLALSSRRSRTSHGAMDHEDGS
ncbi:MAG: aldehyde dehydrogenase family protein [Planctomycetota bacterium]|nr:MAG: aldehyde dehydrogenase family protein [Planctomycetota bacterium]